MNLTCVNLPFAFDVEKVLDNLQLNLSDLQIDD
jgi:hypothetical protein